MSLLGIGSKGLLGDYYIRNPISYRTVGIQQNRDDKGRFSHGFHDTSEPEISDKTGDFHTRSERNFGVQSTAIDHARYDPKDGSLNIAYKSNPDKEYKFAATEDDVRDWMYSPSKGRITHEWKQTHRYPGY